jgi:hypothetical protein
MQQRVRFRLSLSAEQVLAHYRGAARQVSVVATDGRRVQFPAASLRPFVSPEGVHGLFELRFGPEHKLQGLERIGA